MFAKNSEKTPNKIKTRSKLEPNGTINSIYDLRVGVNGNTLNNYIPVNDQPNINIEDILETVFLESITNEVSKIPHMKQRLQEGKITADEYNDELINLKDRLKEIVNKMNVMRDNIKTQDKKIENESINPSTAIKYVEEDMEKMEQNIVERCASFDQMRMIKMKIIDSDVNNKSISTHMKTSYKITIRYMIIQDTKLSRST